MSYTYHHAVVLRVIDGDTVALEIDMGNHIKWRENFRLYGIDAPEKTSPDFRKSTYHLTELLMNPLSKVETYKPDKFGRWLADLYIPANNGELHVNRLMVVEGYAKEYFGGKRS